MQPTNTTQPQQQNPVNPQEVIKNQQTEANRLDKLPVHLSSILEHNYWEQLTIEQKQVLMGIDKMPTQLSGVVPESVWSTLSVNQKLEFLFEKNLLPRTNVLVEAAKDGPYFEQDTQQTDQMKEMETQLSPTEPSIKGEVNIGEHQKVEKDFSEAVSEFEKVAQEGEDVATEKPGEAPDTPVTQPQPELPAAKPKNEVKLHGYGVSEKITNDIEKQMDGDVDKSSTWAATIVAKLLGIFG